MLVCCKAILACVRACVLAPWPCMLSACVRDKQRHDDGGLRAGRVCRAQIPRGMELIQGMVTLRPSPWQEEQGAGAGTLGHRLSMHDIVALL